MEFALLHLLFLMNAFDMTTEKSISFYRFRVNGVERCPMNASEFETSARRRNCTGNDRYLCAPDRNLSSLIEFCTDTSRSLFGKGNCLRLEGTGNLNHYNCEERFVSGCPTEPYADDEIYKYPACLELDLDFHCFVAEKNCQKRLLTTTDKYFNDSKDGKAKPETFDGSIKLQLFIVFLYGFLCVAILSGSVAIYIYKREEYEKGTYLDDEEYGNKQKGENEKKLREFLRREKITVRHARGIIVGCSGAGKTTLLRRLANANYNDLQKIKSTGLVDVHVNKFVLTEEGTMIPREEKDEDQTTIKITSEMMNSKDINQSKETDIEKTDVSKGISYDKDFSSNVQKTKRERWSECNENRALSLQNHSKQENKKLQPTPDQMLLENKDTNNENNDEGMEDDGYETIAVSEIMDYLQEMSGTEYLGPQITFLDFAGQKMYYSYHQIYLRPGTFYILVVDMTKKLDEKVEDPETDEKGCTRFESWTYKDYYEFWLKSIDRYSDESTPVIVVGTHADKIEETVFKSFFDEFFGLFSHNVYQHLYRHLHKDRKYAIGFPTKGVKMKDLKDLKKCIAKIVNSFKHSEERIQPVWAIFEQYLLKVKKHKKIISRAELLKFNERVLKEDRIHDDDITNLLKFLNKAGTVLFFEEERLKDTVILDFQWLVDAFKCIINYHVDLDKPTDNKREHFQWTGELEDEELNAIWKKCPNEGKDYFKNKTQIIAYMEQLGLLAKCHSKRPYSNETPWYLVPSMNRKKFDETILKNFSKSSILCFQFKEEQLPMHVFYGVVFQCFKIPGWSILTDEKEKEICIYEKVACFLFHDRIVVLCVCKSQIQVQICDLEKEASALTSQTEVQNEVSKIIQTFEKYPSSVGYKCQNGVFNNENDTSFFSKESFPDSQIICRTCKEGWHKVDNKVCWIGDPFKNDSDAQTEKSVKHEDGKHAKKTAEEEGPLVGNSEHIKDQADENDKEMKISSLDIELSKATEENEVVKKEHMDKERYMDEINTEESEKVEKKETEDAERNKEAFIIYDIHNKEFERGSRPPATPELSNFSEENKQPENEKDKYEYFWQKESVFSQWYPSKFVVDGVEYSCAEQYMMQQKAVLMNDMKTADIIMELDKPNEMKHFGRYVKNFNQRVWDQHCMRIVEKGNIAKFSQNDDLKMTLFSTYPKTLVEASPYDKIWGIGLRKNDPRAWSKSTWLGKNLLGEILTRVRDKLREEM